MTKKKWIKLLAVFLSVGILSADWDITGQITAINPETKVITLGGYGGGAMNIQVLPHTQLDGDDCGLFGLWDTWGSFNDLYVGQIVEVDLLQGVYPYNAVPQSPDAANNPPLMTARKIEWKCTRRAY